MCWLDDNLRPVEGAVKGRAKIDEDIYRGEQQMRLNYSLIHGFTFQYHAWARQAFSTVNPPLSRRKSTGFCTPFSPQIRRFSASFPHDLNIIFTHINVHNFSADFAQEFAGSTAEKNGEKAAVNQTCGKKERRGPFADCRWRFPPAAFGVRWLASAFKSGGKPPHSRSESHDRRQPVGARRLIGIA